MTRFSVSFDGRSKEVLIGLLQAAMKSRQEEILAGDYSTECLIRYEEVSRLLRGILYAQPEEEPIVEQPLPEKKEVLE